MLTWMANGVEKMISDPADKIETHKTGSTSG